MDVPNLSPFELYRNSEVFRVVGANKDTDTSYYFSIRTNYYMTMNFTYNSSLIRITEMPKFTDILYYNGKIETGNSKFTNSQSSIAYFDMGDYICFDYSLTWIYTTTLYIWGNQQPNINYLSYYPSYYTLNIAPINPQNLRLNNTYMANYYGIDGQTKLENGSNTIWNTYNYTVDNNTFISNLNLTTEYTYSWIGRRMKLNGVAQKNILLFWAANYTANINANNILINTNNTLEFTNNFTYPSGTDINNFYGLNLYLIGIKKTTLENLINQNNNQQNLNNGLKLIEQATNGVENLVIMPYITIGTIVLGIIGLSLYRLLKRIFL